MHSPGIIPGLNQVCSMYGAVPRRVLLQKAATNHLRPSLQKEVLHRGITAGFSSIEDILEKAKDIEDSSRYDIGSQRPAMS